MLTTQPCKVNCVVCYLHSVCDLRSILKLTLGSLALSIYLIQLSLLTFIFLWSSCYYQKLAIFIFAALEIGISFIGLWLIRFNFFSVDQMFSRIY